MTVSTAQPAPSPTHPGHVYVAVDLGGAQTRTAIFDPDGAMLVRRAIATPRSGGPDAMMLDHYETFRRSPS